MTTAIPHEPGGRLEWPIKSSFRDYVLALSDGSEKCVLPATSDGQRIRFPEVDGDFDPGTGSGRLSFSGVVEYGGYAGMLDIRLANPFVTVSRDAAQLWCACGPAHRARDIPIATIELDRPTRTRGKLRWIDVVPRLTLEGSRVFNDVYQPGTPFDPLTIIAQGPGGSVDVSRGEPERISE